MDNLKYLVSDENLNLYTVYHDIGKPYCIEIVDNKTHFPNHSEVSYYIFKNIFDNELVAELIRNDMAIHVLKSKDIIDFCKLDNHITLLIVGLAEIHSNAKMFGGIDSVSFKIKWKNLNQRGKQIMRNQN